MRSSEAGLEAPHFAFPDFLASATASVLARHDEDKRFEALTAALVRVLDENGKLTPADRWQVFEERSFRSRRNELAEPREAVISDVTGDGKNDLIVVVHDRLILYPQE